MSDKPTQLHVAKLEPNVDVVETLRYWIAEAKSGRIRGVILMGVTTSGGRLRSSKGEVGDANAVYLAQLVIADAMEGSKQREDSFELPDRTDDDE